MNNTRIFNLIIALVFCGGIGGTLLMWAREQRLIGADRAELREHAGMIEVQLREREKLSNHFLIGGVSTTLLLSLLIWSLRRTERRAIQQARSMNRDLYEQARILRLSQRVAHIGVCTCDVRTGVITRSPEYLDLFSLGSATAPSRNLLQLVHPDDMQASAERLKRFIRGEPNPPHMARVNVPGKGERVFLFEQAVLQSEQGRPLTMLGVVQDITHTKLTEDALKATENNLRLSQFAIDNARDAIAFLTPEGDRIYVNEETCRLTGYAQDELLNTKIWQTFTRFTPESYRKTWEQLKLHGTLVFETEIVTKGGGTIPVEAKASHFKFGEREIVFALARDITARRKTEAALREREAKLRLLEFAVDHSQDFLTISDREGNRLYISEPFCRFSGYTREQLLPTKVWHFVPTLNGERYQALYDDVRRCGTLVFEFELTVASGEKKPIEANATHLVYDGQDVICTISRDLTSRKAAESEKLRIEKQLQDTQKLESLGVLAGGIAHDFNNLLTGILGNANLARDILPPTAPVHEQLRQVEQASMRAAELCQQMLAYAGKGRFIVKPVNISTMVKETTQLLELSVSHRATLELQLDPAVPMIMADATQIRQVVMNLVLNAAEAINHPNGKIIVRIGQRVVDAAFLTSARITESLKAGPVVTLEVEDNGCGMDEATLSRVFEPFFTTKFTGRGLGLAAVIGIVRSHQGSMHLRSKLGEGTYFLLAFAPTDQKPGPVTRSPFILTNKKGQNLGRVLVVDDEESVRQVTTKALERAGFTVVVAEDGEKAIEQIKMDSARFDVVLLDYVMPRLDGAQTLREIHRINPMQQVILMSGYSEIEARERIGSETLAGFIQKPFDIAVLRRAVEAVIGVGTKV